MRYSNIPRIDIPASKIVFGCENPLMVQGKHFRSQMLLDEAYKQGINVYDTARVYGESERVLGAWIKKRKIREKVIIISKGCHPNPTMRITPEALQEDLEESLKQLDSNYIDIYLLHRDSADIDIPAVLATLNDYRDQGKIKTFGVSNWTHERIEYANVYADKLGMDGFSVSSPNYGVAIQIGDPWGGGISIAGNNEAIEWYSKSKMPVFAYSCLGRGLFSGKIRGENSEVDKGKIDKSAIVGYWCDENINRLKKVESLSERKHATVAQISMSYIINSEMNDFPIVRLSTKKRVREAVGACDVCLSKDEIRWIEE